MRKCGIIRLIFVHYGEAIEFKKIVEEKNGYEVELIPARGQEKPV